MKLDWLVDLLTVSKATNDRLRGYALDLLAVLLVLLASINDIE